MFSISQPTRTDAQPQLYVPSHHCPPHILTPPSATQSSPQEEATVYTNTNARQLIFLFSAVDHQTQVWLCLELMQKNKNRNSKQAFHGQTQLRVETKAVFKPGLTGEIWSVQRGYITPRIRC